MRSWLTVTLVDVLQDRRGISAMEYAILAAAVLGVVGAAAVSLGGDIGFVFNELGTYMKSIRSPHRNGRVRQYTAVTCAAPAT